MERAWLPSPSGETSIDSLLRLARKYIWPVAICSLVGLAYAAYQNARAIPLYRAVASIQLTQDTANQFRLDRARVERADTSTRLRLETEIAILDSSSLALETVRSLQLDTNKDFAALPSRPSVGSFVSKRSHVLIGVLKAVSLRLVWGTPIFFRSAFTSPNPNLAAIICNKQIENYVEHNFKDNYQATEQVSKWLQAQLGELRLRLQSSQERMLSLQNQIGIVGIDQTQSIALARLEGLNTDLTKVESERMVQEARLIAMNSSPPGVLATFGNDPVITQLRETRAHLNDEYSLLSSKYGGANPRMVALREEIAQLDESIRSAETGVICTRRKGTRVIRSK